MVEYSQLVLQKSSNLYVSLDSEYTSNYPEAFPVIINWNFHFESFRNFFNFISILPKYLDHKF